MSLGFKKLSVGQLVLGIIKTVNDTEMVVALPSFLIGFIHYENAASKDLQAQNTSLRKLYSPGEWIQCSIINIQNTASQKKKHIELSINPSHTNSSLKLPDFEYPQLLMALAKNSEDHGLVVEIRTLEESLIGFCSKQDANSIAEGKFFLCNVHPQKSGSSRAFHVEPFKLERKSRNFENLLESSSIRPGVLLNASIKKSLSSDSIVSFGSGFEGILDFVGEVGQKVESIVTLADSKEKIYYLRPFSTHEKPDQSLLGKLIDAKVSKVVENVGVWLEGCIDSQPVIFVHVSNISDSFSNKNLPSVEEDLNVRVIEWDPFSSSYIASCKSSVLEKKYVSIRDFKIGDIVKGKVEKIEEFGIFVLLEDNFRALCPVSQLTESQTSEALKKYHIGAHFRFRVLQIDYDERKIVVTRKKGMLESSLPPLYCLSTAQIGDIYDGFIASIKDYGAIIRFYGDVKGLLPASQFDTSDTKYFIGQVLRFQVTKVEPSYGKLMLKLPKTTDIKQDNNSRKRNIEILSDKLFLQDILLCEHSSDSLSETQTDSKIQKPAKLSCTQIPNIRHLEDESVSGKTYAEDSKNEFVPNALGLNEAVEDFERQLIGQPNNSGIWIQYVASLLRLSEIDLARKTVERALKTINFRNEQDKLNVWIAYLNLENAFGSSETTKAVLDRALVYNDPKIILMRWIKILEDSKKYADALKACEMALKKFRQSCKVWLALISLHFRTQSLQLARKTFSDSLKALPQRKHVKITCKLANMEYRQGEIERGRTLFEGILASAPKRLDIWLIYIALEEGRVEDPEYIRRLYERVLTLKLSSKKAKFFFRKFLEFEHKFGTAESMQHVKELAVQYVECN